MEKEQSEIKECIVLGELTKKDGKIIIKSYPPELRIIKEYK